MSELSSTSSIISSSRARRKDLEDETLLNRSRRKATGLNQNFSRGSSCYCCWSSNTFWMVLVILAAFRISDVVGKVHIKELRVPQSVPNGTEESVILDCDYTLDNEDKLGLVVKWFFNKGNAPVYQWIKGEKPQVLGLLRDRVDLKYKASDDSWEKYRALKIIRPTTDLTGEWACRVSSFQSEATTTSRMVVYAPQKEMDIHLTRMPTAESINVSCWANGVYPEPKLTLLYQGKKLEEAIQLEDVMHDSTWNDGAYDVRVSAVIQDADLELPAIIDCELKIPNTSYIHRESISYGGPVEILEAGNQTSSASEPHTNLSRCYFITWFNVFLLLAVSMKTFGLS